MRTKYIVAFGVLAFAGLIAVILWSANPPPSGPRTVHIEVRASRRAMLSVGGHGLGLAPRQIEVPASTAPIEIHADFGRGRTIDKTVVPDRDQVVQLDGLPTTE